MRRSALVTFHVSCLAFGSMMDVCGLQLTFHNLAETDPMHQNVTIKGHVVGAEEVHVKAWDNCWLYGASTNTLGALLDVQRRQIAMCLNGVNGLRVAMPEGWASNGLTIRPCNMLWTEHDQYESPVSISTPACVPKGLAQLPLDHGLCPGCELCQPADELE